MSKFTRLDAAKALAKERWPEKEWKDITEHSQEECKRYASAVLDAIPDP